MAETTGKVKSWVIKGNGEGRFIVVSVEEGHVLDDAQGYGYKTADGAARAAWFKFDGGKKKKTSRRVSALRFWRANKELAKYARIEMLGLAKVILTGEYSMSDVMRMINNNNEVQIPAVWYLDYIKI